MGKDAVKAIRYTEHARQRMAARSISAAEVETVLRTKAIDVPAQKGRRRAIGNVGGRRITVVYRETANTVTVVTVY